MSKEVAEVLRAAREKISVPERWTQGAMARHANGNPIGPSEPDATCWCAIGSLIANAKSKIRATIDADDALCRAAGRYIVDFNDALTTTHADILAIFDRAIAAEEATP